MITLQLLTDLIRAHESDITTTYAESHLWGDFCKRMRALTGVLPYRYARTTGEPGEREIPDEDAGWWLGAYERAYERTLPWDHESEIPAKLRLVTLTAISDVAGRHTEEFTLAATNGYNSEVAREKRTAIQETPQGVSKEALIECALNLRSESGENEEYDRALVELVWETGVTGLDRDGVADVLGV